MKSSASKVLKSRNKNIK